ncbi:probable multidrug resistance-associated protein lethal(2)03659 isoform X2 [Sitophilus oryzae]|uniref:Probable multidrug resistance-associated protein lethal(2)03659 isoform X2 n=1 Tax=Sitophilus oryzae TaxID=7048 RepID=A0A6J2XT99_SITOR|nr:probable multidrug resistance-associated protein lethal(2)03659 isoform X2 [Sitophilus oryzae]
MYTAYRKVNKQNPRETANLLSFLTFGSLRPYAMSKFVSCFDKNQSTLTKSDAFYYGGIVIFLSLLRCLWVHNYYMLECILSLQIKASISSLIYRKILKLSPNQISGTNMGNVVTILTKDVRALLGSMWPLSDLFIGSFQIIVSCIFLYVRMGNVSLIGVAVLLVTITIQVLVAKAVMKMRLKVGKMADKRLELTREALSSLKVIKMYTWENFFHNRICTARLSEMGATLKAWYYLMIVLNIGSLVSKMSFPILIMCYIRFGYTINTEFLFYIMGLYKDIGHIVGGIIPNCSCSSAEFFASVKRIENLLNADELDKGQQNQTETPYLTKFKNKSIPTQIELKNVSAKIGKEKILKDVTLNITEPGLYIVIGPLGSGKSTLLKVLLQDITEIYGSIDVKGRISFASQEPWLFPATIKRNIIFGEDFDRTKYNEVIEVCCLKHDFQTLVDMDNTVVTDGGLNLSRGQQARINLARAIYRDSDIYLLDDPLAGLDVRVQEAIISNCLKNFLKNKIVIFVTNNLDHLKYAKEIIIIDRGEVKIKSATDEVPVEIITKTNFLEENRVHNNDVSLHEISRNIYHEEKQMGHVDFTHYVKYIKFGGGVVMFTFIFGIFVSAQFTESYSEKLLSKWVDHQHDSLNNSSTNTTVLIDEEKKSAQSVFNLYMIMIGLSTGLDLIKACAFLTYCRNASIKFHKTLCHSIMNCVITFLDNHFIGNILNRFSYDLDLIDELFPFLFMEIIKNSLAVAGVLVLVISVNKIFLFISIFMIVLLVLLRTFYIPAARALTRLSALTRSPLIGHINASLEGLSTVRAFEAQPLLKDEFDKHQNVALSSAYMETTAARAFGYALDSTGALFLVMVILAFLFMDTDNTVGNVGLAVTQVFQLTNSFQWSIQLWAELEQCMTSVERVMEYTNIEQEDKEGKTPKQWMKTGKIEYRDVNLSYNIEEKVLKNINFVINPNEKIGIVGRTGAGKSSIISTLFRLYHYQGYIFIDNVDISSLSLQHLRKHISIIPQYSLTFEGTVRANLDPCDIYSDKEIWDVLDKITLTKHIPNLDINLTELKLSTGQEHLICLGRAFLSKNKIIVFDEPTASLDSSMSDLVQNLINIYFANCTIITIAHRLESILQCDRVMVLDDGCIAEFDSPQKLLENENGLFKSMIEVTRVKI